MKKIYFLIPILVLLAGCGQKRYDYTTFEWPPGTENATVIYNTPSKLMETETNEDLDMILWRTQSDGWEYVGAVGNTCILRRPEHVNHMDFTGSFSVVANAPK